ncbi:secretory subunit [Microbotryomycetes sp. JL201]|nr:secretory subunit [Microbotryomycetes sp. JL201]
MSRLPGSFEPTDSASDQEMDEYADMPGMFLTGTDPISADESDSDDDSFVLDHELMAGDEDDEDVRITSDGSQHVDDDDDQDEDEDARTQDGGGGDSLQLAFDVHSRQIMILDSQGNASPLTPDHLRGSNLSLNSLRALLLARLGLATGQRGARQRAAQANLDDEQDENDQDQEDDDEDEDDDDDYEPFWGASRRKFKNWYPKQDGPAESGIKLLRSGDFGPAPPRYSCHVRKFAPIDHNMTSVLRAREINLLSPSRAALAQTAVPNSSGVEVSQFESKVYSGQYSADGNFFYSACQDMRVYIYDTLQPPRVGSKSVMATPPRPRTTRRSMYADTWQHRSSMKTKKIVRANYSLTQWTVTDANLSPGNGLLVYSSITPFLHLVKTGEGSSFDAAGDDDQQVLDITNGHGSMSRFGVWSVRFSNDAKEIIAGANDGQMFVYDLESQRTILRVNAHKSDVNAVSFADKSSPHLLLSGSDDCYVKVWDRRSLSGQRASGTLVGHTEGITFVAPKGDGRYCLSNGKDQAMKLWDLRKMFSSEDHDKLRLDRDKFKYSIPTYDYRQGWYPRPKYLQHPHDVSVMTYRGHAVLRTLIRCHFSPVSATNQQYVYSGSADGRIHIWSLDGQVVQTIDRKYTHPLLDGQTGDYNDPSSYKLRSTRAPPARGYGRVVRDVSWHPTRPELMSTAWSEGQIEGSIARHEWKGALGESVEDMVERHRLEAQVAGYTYDQTGQSYFFVLTVLLCVLLPWTYTSLRGGSGPEQRAARIPPPCNGWNVKSDEIVKSKIGGKKSVFGLRTVFLAAGWLAFAVVVQRASLIEGEANAFDPFQILGVSSSATEKQIKKHYRKLSLKFHPDKLVLGANQTKEEADNQFVQLTKAYKALTDEVSRHNYEMFGHPDGKQEFSQGIALPAWVVESQHKWWVVAAYAAVLGIALPLFVGRWWYGSRNKTKDGVLNSTVAKFFLNLKEDTNFGVMLDILASSDEFAKDPALKMLRKSQTKTAVDDYARITSIVRASADGKQGWVGYGSWNATQKRARVLIAAHMLRVPINDASLREEKLVTVAIALPLCAGMASVVLSHNWLSSYLAVLHLQQFLLQALHPTSSQLLQLPHLTEDIARKASAELGVNTVADFGKLNAGQVEKLLSGWPERNKRDVFEVAKNWPVTSVVDAKFKVVGEAVVTPGAIVSFTLKLRLTPPGQILTSPQLTKLSMTEPENDDDDDANIDELIGRRKKGAHGEEPTPLAHAPYFPKNRKPTWSIFVGDHKLNRVFVQPHKFTDVGSRQVRIIKLSFQAPPGPGLYTFQVYAVNDSFVGTDAQKDLQASLFGMRVMPPQKGEEMAEDDDISEPDEDTLEGQLALMKGQPVKRGSHSSDEDDSEDSDDDDDDSSDSDESDSDSDSDSD